MKFKFPFTKSKEKEVSNEPPLDSTLTILMEAPKNGLVQYLEEQGIKLENVCYKIEDAQYSLIMNSGIHKRLVVIEQGIGIFNDSEARKQLHDLLGLVNNVQLDATLFYSDSSLKSYIQKSFKKDKIDIDYKEFESIGDVIKVLKEYNETYNLGGATDDTIDSPLEYKGKKVEFAENNYELHFKDSEIESVLKETPDDGEEAIKSFVVAY